MARCSAFILAFAHVLASHAAMAGTITGPSVERSTSGQLVVRWTDTDPVDMFQSDRPDATIATATLVSARDTDGVHEVPLSGTARPYFLLRDSRSKAIVRIAERVLPLEQGSNFRDIGGYAAAGGKHVRWGMIYRSGAQPLLTDADVRAVKALGIANLVDLRSDEERVIAPTRLDAIPYKAVGYPMSSMMPGGSKIGQDAGNPMQGIEIIYRNFPTQLAPQVRAVFRTLLAKEGPMVYSCSAGQDRTGFTTALILSTLGVPRETIYADYLLSTANRRPQWEMPPISEAVAASSPVAAFFAGFQKNPAAAKPQPLMTADGTPYLTYAFAEIERRWGSVDAYLQQEIGLGKVDLATLRAHYLE